MSVSYPLPGTKFHAMVQDQMGAKQNWIDSNDLAMMYDGPFPTEFYRQLHTVLHKEFRMRNASKQFFAGKKLSLRKLLSLPYAAATLPLARRKLAEYAQLPHRGVQPLPVMGDPEAAAQPTEQV
jgi:anaerobic magnesium-protoporphyrin IX monomethyl ester cyclase